MKILLGVIIFIILSSGAGFAIQFGIGWGLIATASTTFILLPVTLIIIEEHT